MFSVRDCSRYELRSPNSRGGCPSSLLEDSRTAAGDAPRPTPATRSCCAKPRSWPRSRYAQSQLNRTAPPLPRLPQCSAEGAGYHNDLVEVGLSYIVDDLDDQERYAAGDQGGVHGGPRSRTSWSACGLDRPVAARVAYRSRPEFDAPRSSGIGVAQQVGGGRHLLPRRRQPTTTSSRPWWMRSPGRPSSYIARHSLPGRGQPGQPSGLFRVRNADLTKDGPGRRQRQPLRGWRKAVAEAVFMATKPRPGGIGKVSSVAESVHPEYRRTLTTYLADTWSPRRDAAGAGRLPFNPDDVRRAIDDQDGVRRGAAPQLLRMSGGGGGAGDRRARPRLPVRGSQLRPDQPGPAEAAGRLRRRRGRGRGGRWPSAT